MTAEIKTWTTETVIEVLRALAKEDDLPAHLATGEITGVDTVDTLGIDSLGGAFLIERFEEMTGVQMPDDFLDLEDNIEVIAAHLNDFIAKAS